MDQNFLIVSIFNILTINVLFLSSRRNNKVIQRQASVLNPPEPGADTNNRCFWGRLWFVQDICGIICAVLTWILVLYAEYVVVFVILLPSPHLYYSAVNFVVFQSLAFLAITSHLRAMFSDPVSDKLCFY